MTTQRFKNKDAYGLPAFSEINTGDYLPAIEEAIANEREAIEKIAHQKDAATFENTLVALEDAQLPLHALESLFSNLSYSNSSEDMRKAQSEIAPLLSAHGDFVLMHDALFVRVNDLFERANELGFDAEDARLLSEKHKLFVRGGARLSAERKARLKEINGELSKLTVQFSQNLVKENSGFALVLNKDDLAGLPDDVCERAKALAKERGEDGKYCFIPERSSFTPFLTLSTRRDLRERLYTAYIKRGDNNNDENNAEACKKIAYLRAEMAQLLGYEDYAHYNLDDTMAKTPARVEELLLPLLAAAKKRAQGEQELLQAMAKKMGDDLEIQGWDWWYYAEKVRQEKFALDEEAIKPYFALDTVFAGLLDVAERLFGVKLTEVHDFEKYHEDVRGYNVCDAQGEPLAFFMTDYFGREGKAAGAWMTNYRDQEEGVRPIVVNVCNFPRPTENAPSLLSLEHVRTLFHEFGHGLHGMLSQVKHRSLSGTAVTRDFVEFPSQILEHWAFEKSVMLNYAKHYETGEALPEALFEKMEAARIFNEGFASTEYLAAALLDMRWHSMKKDAAFFESSEETNAFEDEVMAELAVPKAIAPRYRSVNFAHIFTGPGYAAGYYSYIWSAVLDCDGFAAFKESGDIFDKGLAKKYEENVLKRGNSGDPMDAYVAFRGREPQVDALLESRGLAAS